MRINPPKKLAAIVLSATGLLAVAGVTLGSLVESGASQKSRVILGAHDPNSRFSGAMGWGQVEPATIDNGGDPTGRAWDVVWQGWGTTRAIGKGYGYWQAPGVDVVHAVPARVELVAFSLVKCSGHLSYSKIEWLYPEHGQRFELNDAEAIC